MRAAVTITLFSLLAGCASTPEQAAEEAASDRWESCMDSTMASVGPFRWGGSEARIKAAEICKEVVKEKPGG